MRVPEQLKLNKYVEVSIPRASAVLGRLGLHALREDAYTGEEVPDDLNMTESKLDALAAEQRMLEQLNKSDAAQQKGD